MNSPRLLGVSRLILIVASARRAYTHLSKALQCSLVDRISEQETGIRLGNNRVYLDCSECSDYIEWLFGLSLETRTSMIIGLVVPSMFISNKKKS